MSPLTKLRVRCTKARRAIRRYAASRRRGYLVEVDVDLTPIRERLETGTVLVDRRGRALSDAHVERLMMDVARYAVAMLKAERDA